MKLLYITFINLDTTPTSGSSVRPAKIKQSLEMLDIELYTVSGMNNNITVRKKVVKDVKEKLKTWTPDACYIEPPSGPMFYHGDVELIKLLHKKGIPISIFYRDAYWKYPEYSEEKKLSAVEKMKRFVIKRMQVYQWNVFKNNIDIIYFPSMTMAKEFQCSHKDVLPPGAFIPETVEKKGVSNPLQFIFVGGAARNHGTFLTIEAFEKVNKNGVRAKVFYICPEEQWNGLGIDKKQYSDWLEVIHTSGDGKLLPYYEKSDIALLTAPRTFYRDFAVPIKIFEYISYLKPILVTDCTETARVVEGNNVGWVCKDSVDDVVAKIEHIIDHPDEVESIRQGMEKARENNLWISRTKKVILDLQEVSARRIQI